MNDQEFIELSWKLLKAKVIYYLYPCRDNISDFEYDHLERQYLKGCKELHKENTIQNMVEVDQNRPSVKLVINKLLGNYND